MVTLASLVVPIVVSAVFVFAVSSILHMALKYHKADYKHLPKEDAVLDAIRAAAPEPGYYMFPYCGDMKDLGTDEMKAKFERGPVGTMSVVPNGQMAMGKYLGLWFVYCLLVSFFTAYIAAHTIAAGTDYLAVFRVVGAVAFMAYGLANLVDTIWRHAPWSNTIRAMVDGLIYALVTAGTFGWLWP